MANITLKKKTKSRLFENSRAFKYNSTRIKPRTITVSGFKTSNNGVFISKLWRKIVYGNISNEEILREAEILDSIYWGTFISRSTTQIKQDYPKSWGTILDLEDGDIEKATQKVRNAINLLVLKRMAYAFCEVERRNKLRIQKLKEKEQQDIKDGLELGQLSIKYKDIKLVTDNVFAQDIQKLLHKDELGQYNKVKLQEYNKNLDLKITDGSSVGDDNRIYFIITEEPTNWIGKIDEYELAMEHCNPYFNVFKNTGMLSDYLLSTGFVQTFDDNDYANRNRRKNIGLVFYNDVFTVSTYFNTPAYMKNKFFKMSSKCVSYKNNLYLTMSELFPTEIHNFMARSVIVTKDNMDEVLTEKYLNDNINQKYTESDAAIYKSEEIYIVRPVSYTTDDRYTAAWGQDIKILNFHNVNYVATLQKIKALLSSTYDCVVVSKFIKTKQINSRMFHIRALIYASITVMPKPGTLTPDPDAKYHLKGFLSKSNNMMVNTNHVAQTETNIKDYTNINTHNIDNSYSIFPDDLSEDILPRADYENYFAQMQAITKKVLEGLGREVQLYPECISAFQEFGLDFFIGLNGVVYLAEVNIDPGFFFFRNFKLISQINYYKYNNLSGLLRGILEPIFITQKYSASTPYDNYVQIDVSDDLERISGRKPNTPIIAPPENVRRGTSSRSTTTSSRSTTTSSRSTRSAITPIPSTRTLQQPPQLQQPNSTKYSSKTIKHYESTA